jgi:tungstate transport system substrate-binding protein
MVRRLLGLWLVALALAGPAAAQGEFIVVASTTSTENSGLFRYLLPLFRAETGIEVRVVAVGTGQAINLARRGDADVLLVHHRKSEDAFVAAGYGVRRFDLMYNDFLIVGPKDDGAGIGGSSDAVAALRRIAAARLPFISRGDDSGTHQKERALWEAAGIDLAAASGTWYRETGSGMGATLNTAAALDAYTLADRGTWISFRNKRRLVVLVDGDARLFNPYGVILVNPRRFPHVKAAAGQRFIDWLLSPRGQRAIGAFRIDGQRLFTPNYRGGPS